uniref:Secreted protein n=1 Tax=Setaria italica TaxID=4555 RepID=K3ZA96_SETIT
MDRIKAHPHLLCTIAYLSLFPALCVRACRWTPGLLRTTDWWRRAAMGTGFERPDPQTDELQLRDQEVLAHGSGRRCWAAAWSGDAGGDASSGAGERPAACRTAVAGPRGQSGHGPGTRIVESARIRTHGRIDFFFSYFYFGYFMIRIQRVCMTYPMRDTAPCARIRLT